MRTMHLFAGAGGGLLADLILGHTPVVAVEWEPYPCQVLRERAAEGWFPELVVWEGDVRNFDPSEYAERVDCIHAGFPCQDISVAGKQAGVGKGTRSGLYREVLRIAGAVRPRYIFLENVAAIKSNGLEQVVKDLAIMGYDSRWLCIRASDVGAPHHRDRWFLLANTSEQRCNNGGNNREERHLLHNINGDAAQGESERQERKRGIGALGSNVADTECQRLQGQGKHEQPINSTESRDWEATEFKYGSTPDFWKTEPNVGRVVNGVAARVDRLKAIGNGQVPLQVATAFTILASE